MIPELILQMCIFAEKGEKRGRNFAVSDLFLPARFSAS